MSPQHFRRALFVRLDRIGDLVLTLPTDESANIDRVDWWIPRGLSFVTEHAQPQRQSHEFSTTLTFLQLLSLVRCVRRNHYDIAVVFHAPWWVGFALWAARVPIRIGVFSQWHSFLFFNRGVRQKRSRAEHSELEYNFRLLEEGLDVAQASLPRRQLKLGAKSGRPESLTSRLSTSDVGEYFVVHPGMGGSALNWPTNLYTALIQELALKHAVVVTGTASDEAFLAPIREQLRSESAGANANAGQTADGANSRIIWLDGKLSGTELIAVLQNARAVIAPSTGVLHLAASTGVATLGLFSRIRVQRAVRWGPQGARTATLEPPVECPGQSACEGTTCARGNCMNLISVESVLVKLRELEAL